MRKITLFVAGVALFVLIGIDTWLCIRTLGPGDALAGSTDKAPVIMITGAKGYLLRTMMTTRSLSIEAGAAF